MESVEYGGKMMTREARRIIMNEISFLCDAAAKLREPYKDGDNIRIETAITELLRGMVIESAGRITEALKDSTRIE